MADSSASAQKPSASKEARRELWMGLAAAAAILVIWSSFILLTRLGARSTFQPPDLLALRVGIAGLVMAPFLLKNGMGGLKLWQGLIMALLAGIGFGGLAYTAFSLAPVSHAAVLMTGSLPLQTSILAMLVLGERFNRIRSVGLGLIVLGVVMIAWQSLATAERSMWLGDALFVLSAMSWAIYSILAQRWKMKPLQAASVVFPLAFCLYMPLYFLFVDSRLHEAPLSALLTQAVLQGLLATIVSMFAYMRVVVAFGAASTTMLTAAVPGLVTILAIPLLGEIPAWSDVIGVACVTGGIAATILALHRRHS